jgi:hypothetical protein
MTAQYVFPTPTPITPSFHYQPQQHLTINDPSIPYHSSEVYPSQQSQPEHPQGNITSYCNYPDEAAAAALTERLTEERHLSNLREEEEKLVSDHHHYYHGNPQMMAPLLPQHHQTTAQQYQEYYQFQPPPPVFKNKFTTSPIPNTQQQTSQLPV